VLGDVGANGASVEQQWEPYLSLQPAMVLARARRTLSPPTSAALTLAHDTLRLAGAAPLPWVIAVGRVSLPPGVAAMDLSGVTAEIPADLERLVGEIERQRVLFDIGSADLSSRARGVIGQVATALQRLDAGASLIGARATLELVGRTDPTGSDSANQTLSRERAIAVVTALAARGVPTGTARVSGVGTSRPLADRSPDERARINRSVSFGVSLR
jgi:outer membrane protein OmpA-like peptidoglycan-associated protein